MTFNSIPKLSTAQVIGELVLAESLSVTLGSLGVGKRCGSQSRNDQFTLTGIAFRKAFAATGPCRPAEQEQQQFIHDLAGSMAEGNIRRKKIADTLFERVWGRGHSC